MRQGLISSALNHALHGVADGLMGGDPKPPYSKEVLKKIGEWSDLIGVESEVIMQAISIGESAGKASNSINIDTRIINGLSKLGVVSGIVSVGVDIGNVAIEPNKTYNWVKIGSSTLLFTVKMNPAARIIWGLADLTGLSEPVYKGTSWFINSSISGAKSLPAISSQLKYSTVNFNSLYK